MAEISSTPKPDAKTEDGRGVPIFFPCELGNVPSVPELSLYAGLEGLLHRAIAPIRLGPKHFEIWDWCAVGRKLGLP